MLYGDAIKRKEWGVKRTISFAPTDDLAGSMPDTPLAGWACSLKNVMDIVNAYRFVRTDCCDQIG